MVVVLPLPFTPITRTTKGLRARSMASGVATGCRISAMSSAKAARTSSSVTSLPKRSLPSLSTRRAATLTPRSASISASSNWSSVCWSSFFLVNRPVMLSVTRLVDLARPERRRDSQPFFSVSPVSVWPGSVWIVSLTSTPLGEQRGIELALEGKRDGAGHQHVIVAQPFDLKGAAIDDHLGSALHQAAAGCRHHGGTGARAAGEREPGAALPDAQAQAIFIHELGDADIGAFGKESITLQLGPQLAKRDCRGIVDEEGGVRIAHAGADGILQRPEPDRHVIGVAGLADRDVAPVEPRQPHIDGDDRQAIGGGARLLRIEQAGNRLHRDVVGLAFVHQHRSDAARGVAAGAGLVAVGIVDAHEDVGLALGRGLEHDQLVATHTPPPVG